ncbi:response regulator, partial [Burkholderia pseudomallei]|nr:response regulator [Burkholderia pseudomallei]
MVIYLIEDDEIQAQCYQSMLVGHGWQVKLLLDGERAFREIQRMPPDLIILDRRLPDLDGLEVLMWV